MPNRIRINSLTVNNIKCVKHGRIEFNASNDLRDEKASIMGIYGQNGSGKTVAVEALLIVKALFSGEQISNRFLDIISFGEERASIEVELSIVNDEHTDCTVFYRCDMKQLNDPNDSMPRGGYGMAVTARGAYEKKSIIAVVYESLSVSGSIHSNKYRKQLIAQTDENVKIVKPISKQSLLFGNDSGTLKKLEENKLLALYGSRSFLFSDQALDAIEGNGSNDFSSLIQSVRFFAEFCLFIVGGEIQSDVHLPISFVIQRASGGTIGQILLPGDHKGAISGDDLAVFHEVLSPLNNVLAKMMPGLKVDYISKKLTLDDMDDVYEIELFASRGDDNLLPLRHESLGTKKIVSFLSLLIAAYNNPSVVLVLDEFDSSIFEFLLGEIVSIISSSGRGQFIFTSHNLRPLEKLSDTSICFTTTDPMNRYVRLRKKATNNLRDMYFRTISLGNDDFELYNGESKNVLAFAFRQAWGGDNG